MNLFQRIALLALLATNTSYANTHLTISPQQLSLVANKIEQNETAGQRKFLMHWNQGEDFVSLGIGHFIWFPSNYKGPFKETAPDLFTFLANTNLKLPELFSQYADCPWHNIEEFKAAYRTTKVQNAIDFLEATKPLQAAYIFSRLEQALPTMLLSSEHPNHVKQQFYLMANSTSGIYPLIDYVNFKGEGVKPSERYKDEGWGLLDVLENMNANKAGSATVNEFADQAAIILTRRVDNSPAERNEKRWLPGWLKRIDTYRVEEEGKPSSSTP